MFRVNCWCTCMTHHTRRLFSHGLGMRCISHDMCAIFQTCHSLNRRLTSSTCSSSRSMMAVDTVLKSLQALTLLIVIGLVGCLVVFPDAFGAKAREIFIALEKHDITLEVGPDGPTVSYTRSEAAEALQAQSSVDGLLNEVPCLMNLDCDSTAQRLIVDALNVSIVADDDQAPQQGDQFTNTWIVIFGADRTLQAAEFEINSAQELGYELGLIFLDGWYRSVAIFQSQAAAEQALPRVQAELDKDDAYVRSLTRWCSDHQVIEAGTSFVSCEAAWK